MRRLSFADCPTGDPGEPGYVEPRYCECELCGGRGLVYTLRSIFTGAVQVVDEATFYATPCDEEDCDAEQSEWRECDDNAVCPECEGSGYVDTCPDNSSHDIYCRGDERWE